MQLANDIVVIVPREFDDDDEPISLDRAIGSSQNKFYLLEYKNNYKTKIFLSVTHMHNFIYDNKT